MAEVVLRYMVGDGAIHDHRVTGPVDIVKTEEGEFAFCDLDDQHGQIESVLARFNRFGEGTTSSFALEPLVDCYLEPPPASRIVASDKIAIPRSTDTIRHYIHLRHDDTVHFPSEGLKFTLGSLSTRTFRLKVGLLT
jgi:hypothetical protein